MQPILITGEMRSGTTFLANFLNSQKEAVVFADMLVSLFREAHSLGITDIHRSLSQREKNVLISNIEAEGRTHKLNFSTIPRDEDLSWHSIFLAALKIIMGDKQPGIVGIKRTREEKYLRALIESGVKVIYCIRDPRDVLLSAKNRFAEYNLFNAVDNWIKSIINAIELRDSKNFMLLRYEDFILHKKTSVKRLEEFLNISVSLDLNELKYGEDLNYINNSSFGDITKLFDKSAVYRWKDNLSNPEIPFCNTVLFPYLKLFGYETSNTKSENLKTLSNLKKKYRQYKRKKAIRQYIRTTFDRFIE